MADDQAGSADSKRKYAASLMAQLRRWHTLWQATDLKPLQRQEIRGLISNLKDDPEYGRCLGPADHSFLRQFGSAVGEHWK